MKTNNQRALTELISILIGASETELCRILTPRTRAYELMFESGLIDDQARLTELGRKIIRPAHSSVA